MKAWISELKRRRLFQTFALYVVTAWVLIQVAQAAFEAWGVPMQALRYVWIGLILVSPLALVFAWRYDITSAGIIRTPPTASGDGIDVALTRSDYAVLGSLAFVLVMIAWGLIHRAGTQEAAWRPVRDTGRPAIAVLPFADLSADGELGYFGTGMAEALLNELGHLASLDVIARTSSFSFQNTTAGLAEIAAALAVDYLLEGSVSREADNVFVVAKLVEVSSGRQLWSETFEGTSTRPFSAQRGIAGKVAGYLEMSIGDPEEYGGTSNFEAYDLYLREKTETDQATRRVLLDAALAHDPDFALAMLGKAGLALEEVWQNRKNVDEMWREVQPLLARALEIAPELDQSHLAMGVALELRRDHAGAEAALRKALELNPSNTSALARLSRILVATGRSHQGVELAEREARLDPLSAGKWGRLGNRRAAVDDVEGCIDAYERALALEPPPHSWIWTNYGMNLNGFGRAVDTFKVEARRQALYGPVFDASNVRFLGLWLGFAGDQEQADELLRLSLSMHDSAWTRMDLALRALGRSEFEEAWALLWKTLEGDSGNAMANLALASVALARGQGHAEALAFYRERWPGLFRAAPEVGPVNAAAALGVAVLLVDSGQGAEVEKLLESIEREGVSFWPSAVVIARAWRGDLEGSLAGLEETVRPGGDFWPPLDSVLYAPLAAEPRFRALAGQVQADRDAEGARTRAEVATMLERGEFVLPTAANAQLVD